MTLREVEAAFAEYGPGVLHATTTVRGQTCASWHVVGEPIHVYVGESLDEAVTGLLAEVRAKHGRRVA